MKTGASQWTLIRSDTTQPVQTLNFTEAARQSGFPVYLTRAIQRLFEEELGAHFVGMAKTLGLPRWARYSA